MNAPVLSVIIPVYNVKQYLSKCLESVLCQKFNKLEVVIIDDGSTDGSSSICDRYAEKDRRVRVFHQSNGGVSKARNLGIRRSIGKYICFIDSDDWIDDGYFDVFNNINIDIDSYDIFNPPFFDEKYRKIVKVNNNCFYNTVDDYVKGENTLTFGRIFIRREMIIENGIQFPDVIKYGEDTDFYVKCLIEAKGIYNVMTNNYYHYRYNLSSVTNQEKKIEDILDYLKYPVNIINYAVLKKIDLNDFLNGLIKGTINTYISEVSKSSDGLLFTYKSYKEYCCYYEFLKSVNCLVSKSFFSTLLYKSIVFYMFVCYAVNLKCLLKKWMFIEKLKRK